MTTEFVCRTCGCDAPSTGPWPHGEQPRSFGGGQCRDEVGLPRGTSFKEREQAKDVAATANAVDVAQLHKICDSVGVPKNGAAGQPCSIETRVLTMSLMLRGRIDTAAVIAPLAESINADNQREIALRTGAEVLVNKWMTSRGVLLADRRLQEAIAIKGCASELKALLAGEVDDEP